MRYVELIITAKVKLLTNKEQAQELADTLKAAGLALNHASKIAYGNNLLSSFKGLQRLVYTDLRSEYGLKSQMACNICSVVAGAYASMKSNGEHTLAVYKHPKLQYSYGRDYTFVRGKTAVSLLSLNGRRKVPFVVTAMEKYFDGTWRFGTATLVHKKGEFYLHINVKREIAETENGEIKNIVGVDTGMNFLTVAVDSKDRAKFFGGRQIKNKRAEFVRVRKSLQKRGTKRSKRRLQALAGRENRFMTDVNHCVSKALVQFAGKNSLIAREDLTGINLSTVVRKRNRYIRFSWAFSQLYLFMEYKVLLAGARVIPFDPRYSSQKCPKCGHTERANRDQKKHLFCCKRCGYSLNDDLIGAMNMRTAGIEYRCAKSASDPA